MLRAFPACTIGRRRACPTKRRAASIDVEPTTATAESASEAPVLFQSVSGNIVCSMSEAAVICHQNSIKYTAPSAACPSALGGATVGVDRRSVIWPCVDAAFTGATTVAYDTVVDAYGFNCSINYTTGVTCYNAEGSGFTMEYTNGIQAF